MSDGKRKNGIYSVLSKAFGLHRKRNCFRTGHEADRGGEIEEEDHRGFFTNLHTCMLRPGYHMLYPSMSTNVQTTPLLK